MLSKGQARMVQERAAHVLEKILVFLECGSKPNFISRKSFIWSYVASYPIVTIRERKTVPMAPFHRLLTPSSLIILYPALKKLV